MIVKIDNVCLAFLYIPCFFNWLLKYVAISTAMLSTLSSSLPYLGKSPIISKDSVIPLFLIGFTLAYLIADKLSTKQENPAIPKAINLSTSVSCKAI